MMLIKTMNSLISLAIIATVANAEMQGLRGQTKNWEQRRRVQGGIGGGGGGGGGMGGGMGGGGVMSGDPMSGRAGMGASMGVSPMNNMDGNIKGNRIGGSMEKYNKRMEKDNKHIGRATRSPTRNLTWQPSI